MGEIEIDSIPPDNLLCFPEQSPLPQALCPLLFLRGLVAFITDIPGECCGVGVKTELLPQCFSVSLFPRGCWNMCSLCDGHGEERVLCPRLGGGVIIGKGGSASQRLF